VGQSLSDDAVVVVDSKFRVVLERKVRTVAGISKGEKLVAVPFHGGVILTSAAGKKFSGSLKGFAFKEDDHAADKFIRQLGNDHANP